MQIPYMQMHYQASRHLPDPPGRDGALGLQEAAEEEEHGVER